jgi:hypothetical protein
MSDDADTMGMEDDEIAYLVAAEKAKWADDLTADDVDSIVAAARRGLMRAAATEDRRKVSVPQPPLFRYCAFCACGYEWQEGWSDKCGGCTRAESANEAAKRMMEQVDEMAEQRVERNANIKLLRAELAEMKIDRNDWKRISDEAEFRAEVAEAEVARLAQGVTAQAEEARTLRETRYEAIACLQRVVEADRDDSRMGHPNAGDSCIGACIALDVMPWLDQRGKLLPFVARAALGEDA